MAGDPGLQPERTALAWNRTALAVAVNGVLVARGAAQQGSAALGGVAALIFVAAAGFAIVGTRRRAALLAGSGISGAPHAQLITFAFGAVMLVSVAAVLAA